MPRQARWVAAGIYQPTYQPRHAYGPHRRGYRYELVEEFLATPCDVLDAQIVGERYGGSLGGQLSTVEAIPMPRGGVRYVLICPVCKSRVTRLYGCYHPGFRCLKHACRKCWGLRYQSQYAGRRIEAHPDYLQAVMCRQIERTPRDRGYDPHAPARRLAQGRAHRRRMARYGRAEAILSERTSRWTARKDLAIDLALITLLAREKAAQRHRWRKIVNQMLWPGHEPHLPTLRQLVTDKDTPEWARTLLKAELERVEKGAEPLKDARKAIKTALETDKTVQFAAIIEQARMDDLRARYAAFGQARQRKSAA